MGSHPLRTVRHERVTSDGEEASRWSAAVEAKGSALADDHLREFGEERDEQPDVDQDGNDGRGGSRRVECGLDRALRFVVRRKTIVQIIPNPARDSRERDEKENRDQSPHTMSVTKVALRVKRLRCSTCRSQSVNTSTASVVSWEQHCASRFRRPDYFKGDPLPFERW